jgi:ribosomal protein S18 acetylase RimI-like enzyme
MMSRLAEADSHKGIEVIRTYLQMLAPSDLFSAGDSGQSLRIERAEDCPASFYRYLYSEVGRPYHWVDRLGWTDQEVLSHLEQTDISVYVAYERGSPAGYFELKSWDDGSVEIAYFGLLQECIGRGLGKYLLSRAVDTAWKMGANRVWLHTCTLDDRAAMPNYVKRGFKPFKKETYFFSAP